MTIDIPQYGLKAYSLLFSRHGTAESFRQSDLDWIVSPSMKKKIFAVLLRCGWIQKRAKTTYVCTSPAEAITGLLEFRVPEIIKQAKKPYAFTQLSAVEIWSDYAYIQRSREKSPYYLKVLQNDVPYWKQFFHQREIPNYVASGMTIGEYVILLPVEKIKAQEKEGIFVDSWQETLRYAQAQETFAYAAMYIKRKYGRER